MKSLLRFSSFEAGLDFVEDLLETCQDGNTPFRFVRLDSRTSSGGETSIVYLSNNDDRYNKVFLFSIREGLNLMSLSTVAFLDQDRNLRVMKQAASRAHRIE